MNRVENIVTKGEIIYHEQFILLSQCFFQKPSAADASRQKAAASWTWFNPFLTADAFWRNSSRRLFENIMAKGEIARDEQFPLLPQCFQLFLTIKLSFMEIFSGFCHHVFKVVCCIFAVCGKWFHTEIKKIVNESECGGFVVFVHMATTKIKVNET